MRSAYHRARSRGCIVSPTRRRVGVVQRPIVLVPIDRADAGELRREWRVRVAPEMRKHAGLAAAEILAIPTINAGEGEAAAGESHAARVIDVAARRRLEHALG